MEKKNVTLWANNSFESQALKESFATNNYDVTHVLTGASRPVARVDSTYLSGSNQINSSFGFNPSQPVVHSKNK